MTCGAVSSSAASKAWIIGAASWQAPIVFDQLTFHQTTSIVWYVADHFLWWLMGADLVRSSHDLTSIFPTIMQLFISLRFNRLHLLAHIWFLSSARITVIRPRSVKALVGAAKGNVWVCKTATESRSIPALLWITFVHFLMAAVSSVVLAATYNPTRYGTMCWRPSRQEIKRRRPPASILPSESAQTRSKYQHL